MCCLFGILDYGSTLTQKQRTKTFSLLARASEVRGTDATGVAYNTAGRLVIYKRPLAAHKMKFRFPEDANILMGHTRMTTQGDEKFNYNNHPFFGKANDTSFALAHNGIISNDLDLQIQHGLPTTNIKTDSYTAVQMIEKAGALNVDNLITVSESLKGTFNLSVLDQGNNMYLVKGNNPLCVYHFQKRNLYLYASTEEILKNAIFKLSISLGKFEKLHIEQGDIIKIDSASNRETVSFSTVNLYSTSRFDPYHWDRFFDNCNFPSTKADKSYTDTLKSMAPYFGYVAKDVDDLLSDGFTPEDIEEIFYCGY